MTDEVKEALDWWHHKTSLGENGGKLSANILAHAFAAEHPADDDELVTPEWLQATDWNTRQCFTPITWWFRRLSCGEIIQLHYSEEDREFTLLVGVVSATPWPKPITTRGQLRRLLKELGE